VIAAVMVVVTGVVVWTGFARGDPDRQRTAAASDPASMAGAPPTPGDLPSASVTASPAPATRGPRVTPGKLLVGIGDEADRAAGFALTRQAPVKMLTSWYNRPSDFGEFMNGWKNSVIPRLYRAGYAMHVVQWTPEVEGQFTTSHGPACGRSYPLSSAFLDDVKHLAQIFGGPADGPPFYVTLFTEFSTYPCVDNEWDSAANYYLALKDQYRSAYQVLHANAPNVHVSLGFGGWLGTYDYPQKHGGRSLISRFDDVMRASDFQSFQAMANPPNANVEVIRTMTSILHPYGPVMLAHYKPDNGSQATFNSDIRSILTDAFVDEITRAGLFAMSFMTTDNVDADPSTFQFIKSAVLRYGCSP
jgi:hypothetical protein